MRLVPVATALLLATNAHAWSHADTEHELAPQVVRAKLEGPIVTFTARFVISVDAGMFGQAYGGIALPRLGIVTGARATLNGTEHVLSLENAEEARKKFDALATEEPPKPGEKRSALILSGEPGTVSIGIASGRSGVLMLEMTVRAPTCFANDVRYVAVPESWRKVAEVSLRTLRTKPETIDDACGSTIQSNRGNGADTPVWMAFPTTELAKRTTPERMGAFGGRLALGDQHIARVELDLAAQMSDVPRDLATVILVDGSRSMSPDDLEAQRQLVASYLRAAPDSRVQVLAYARRTRPLLPSWTTASQAAGRVDRELRALGPRNGSHFDVALADAASWLDRTTGTKRVVLVTDERMSERLDALSPATLKRLLPAGTLVHVVALGGSQLVRDEEIHLAPLAAATDGMPVRAGHVDDATQLDATMLVRPISFDFVTVKAPGWTQITPRSDVACGDDTERELPEGSSCTWWGEGDPSSGPIVLEGLVWGKRTQRLVQPDTQRGTDVARELSALGMLDEKLLERIDFAARGVNAKWSLYTQWGGSQGYGDGFGFGMSGIGGGGCGCDDTIGTIGHGTGVGGYYDPPDLARQLRPLVAACSVDKVDIDAKLEFTYLEIAELSVELRVPDGTSAAAKRTMQTCVEDALWDAQPVLTHIAAHQSFDVALPAR